MNASTLGRLLQSEFPADSLAFCENCRRAHATDASGRSTMPAAVVKAADEEQVARLLRLSAAHGFPVTLRGAGTGTAGGAVPEEKGVVLSLARLEGIPEVAPQDLLLRARAGTRVADVKRAAAAHGLSYPPDPASLDTATIGGTIATNAGGPACVKYGVTRAYVMGLRVVLPGGEILATGARCRKQAMGYDLSQLVCGSEGTLGVVTEATLRLCPKPETTLTLALALPDLPSAMTLVAKAMTSGITPSAAEFVDARGLALIRDDLPMPMPRSTDVLVIFETDGVNEAAQAEMQTLMQLCKDFGHQSHFLAESEADRAALWAARRKVATRIIEESAAYLPEDVAVPLSCITDFCAALPDIEARHRVTAYAFGHSGDGNIHAVFATQDESGRERLHAAAREAVKLAAKLGGVVSGEHGVGKHKTDFVKATLSPRHYGIYQGIKRLFDPEGLLNPGVLLKD